MKNNAAIDVNAIPNNYKKAVSELKDVFFKRNRPLIDAYINKHGKGILKSVEGDVITRCCSVRSLNFALEYDLSVYARDSHDWNVFHYTAYENKLEFFKYLFNTYPKFHLMKTGRTNGFWTNGNGYENVLHCAARGESPNILEFILEEDIVDVNSVAAKNKTALHWAMEKKETRSVLILIKQGANIHLKNDSGKTPLQACKDKAFSEIIKYLSTNKDWVNEVEINKCPPSTPPSNSWCILF